MRPDDHSFIHGYLVAKDTNARGLEEQVVRALHKGWSCVGGVGAHYNPSQLVTWWYQAMEKDMREEK